VPELAQRGDTVLRLLPQPFADLGLIGELAHAEEFARQRIVIERLAVRETAPARAQGVEQLADDNLRPVATFLVRARIQTGAPAHFVPQIKPPGHRLDRDESRVDGVIGVGDKLQFEPGLFLGDRSHAFSDQTHQNKFTINCKLLPYS
jgi:hypothetical protein